MNNRNAYSNKQNSSTAITVSNIGSQSVNYANSAGSANSVAWGNVSGKPSSYTPSSHTHVSYGTNSNGAYYKFDDGTLICTKILTLTISCTTVWGSAYETSSAISFGNYAYAFISAPALNVTAIGGSSFAQPEIIFNRSGSYIGDSHLFRPQSKADFTVQLSFVAVGRWK